MSLPGAKTWAGLIGLTIAAWFALEGLRPVSTWTTLEAPAELDPDRPFPANVEFTPPLPLGRFSVDLHAPGDPDGRTTVVAVFQQELVPGQHRYHVEIPLRVAVTSEFVRAVVYLGPTGRWQDRTRAAISEDIPVTRPAASATSRSKTTVRHRMADQGGPSTIPRVRFLPARAATSMVWCIAGWLALTRGRRSDPRRLGETGDLGRNTNRFGWACLVAGVAEATDLGGRLGDVVRSFARRASVYDGREPGQQIVTALVLAGTLALFTAVGRAPASAPRRLARLATVCGLGLLAVDALSLHAIDRLAQTSAMGWPAIQSAGLACALVACGSIWADRRSVSPSPTRRS